MLLFRLLYVIICPSYYTFLRSCTSYLGLISFSLNCCRFLHTVLYNSFCGSWNIGCNLFSFTVHSVIFTSISGDTYSILSCSFISSTIVYIIHSRVFLLLLSSRAKHTLFLFLLYCTVLVTGVELSSCTKHTLYLLLNSYLIYCSFSLNV